MFKKILIFIVSAVFMINATACTMLLDTTNKYLSALNNTQNADSLQSKTECTVNIDLSKTNQETKKKLEKFKDITINMDETVDRKNQKEESNIFLSAGDIITTSKTYVDGDKIFMKLGDKYIQLYPDKEFEKKADIEKYVKDYEELYDGMAVIWKESVQNEILSSQGNSVEHTPDGDIKVTQLSLELTDDKAKNILSKLTDIVSKNESVKKMAAENTAKFFEGKATEAEVNKNVDQWFKDLSENTNKAKEKFSLEKLKLTAKIDKDSYIIDETLEGTLVIKYEGEIRVNFNVHTSRWNINNEQVKVNIPQIKKEDLVDMKSFDKKSLEHFKQISDMFENK
ncbi:MAG: hypothetical protein N3B21_17630 [Clostridia bacterium]|nr:hypothetical protein [Clostridia bacterium]